MGIGSRQRGRGVAATTGCRPLLRGLVGCVRVRCHPRRSWPTLRRRPRRRRRRAGRVRRRRRRRVDVRLELAASNGWPARWASRTYRAAASVGDGFRVHAEDSDGEQATDANGAGADERTPQDVADGLVPFGCPGVEAGHCAAAGPGLAADVSGRVTAGSLSRSCSTTPRRSRRAEVDDDAVGPAGQVFGYRRRRGPDGPADSRRVSSNTTELVQDTRREVGPDAAAQVWDESVVRRRQPGQPDRDREGAWDGRRRRAGGRPDCGPRSPARLTTPWARLLSRRPRRARPS